MKTKNEIFGERMTLQSILIGAKLDMLRFPIFDLPRNQFLRAVPNAYEAIY